MSKRKLRTKNSPRLPQPVGWLTSDADEIERRRKRGATEKFHIKAQTKSNDFYGTWQVDSDSGQSYRVEIRSLEQPINSCECPDQRVNGLGTCKHIEATLLRMQHRRKRAFQAASHKGNPQFEIFLDRRDHQVRICWPASPRPSKARDLLSPLFSSKGLLVGEPLDRLPAMQRTINASHPALRRKIKISKELNSWLKILDQREQQIRNRQHFETEVAVGNDTLDLLKQPLYPYQREGMLHLAFTGRALLADEMGLGKTVQAIAACELLRRIIGIKRVLVIAPASLKGEWEEQIAKFTNLSSHIIQGSRARRLRQYQQPEFFSLANYEQIRSDVDEINTILAPDIVILDEAQRIKNWQTQTAESIKRLSSPYAFVLTGTPIENRIDEIYSIIQFLDPHTFGPLFRFNRDFYQLDEKGRAIGYKNLNQLHERLLPVMLRRRKEDVEGQLPGRTVNHYFVPMHKEQLLRYGEYEMKVGRIATIAKKRPLTAQEMKQLQSYLACMRMLCDTPYILDPNCRICPKLKELGNILQELKVNGNHKIIIFSEWERMLHLVRDLAGKMGLDYALHTGKISQSMRRNEIQRFKKDPACQLFLSTDSGSVGLNLQAADVVINLDMPWNPAKLEQRIARAWRKHQQRPVQVINLVSEYSIEHKMLTLLEQKRAMAKGVLDGEGDNEMRLPSGRAAFLERLDTLLGVQAKGPLPQRSDPLECLRDDLLSQGSVELDLIELYGEGEQQTLLIVTERSDESLRRTLIHKLNTWLPDQTPQLKLLDRTTFEAIQQLIDAGILQVNEEAARTLHRAAAVDSENNSGQAKRLSEARDHLAQSEHHRRMAKVLAEGHFVLEALAPMRKAVEAALQALTLWHGRNVETPPDLGEIDSLLITTDLLPDETLPLVVRLRDDHNELDNLQAEKLYLQSERLYSQASLIMDAALE